MKTLSNLILNPEKTEHEPIFTLIMGFFYAILSFLLAIWVFPGNSSLPMIFLATISCLYLTQKALLIEEKKEKDSKEEKIILRSHKNILSLFFFLFLGFLLAYVVITITFPEHYVNEGFNLQKETLNQISGLTGKSISPNEALNLIIRNNLRVLIFSLIFSIFYGAGAIFILIWNSSIMGFVIGNTIKASLNISYTPAIFLKYLIHGLPEMISYFIAALAGGILYVAIIKGDLRKNRFKRIITDTTLLLFISVTLLIISAVIEVFVSSSI